MSDYMSDTNAVLQNLKDAGCDDEVVKTFMKLVETGEKQKQYRLLEKHRRNLPAAISCGLPHGRSIH